MPTAHLTLYIRTGCPYCAKVLAAGQELGISFTEKNVAHPDNAQELIQRGGKLQMPYLVNEDTGEALYESDDIVDYLHKNFGKGE